MSSIVYDESGRVVLSQKPHDDEWDYDPEPRITQAGDQILTQHGMRWTNVITIGSDMADHARYRRKKATQ
jgi:hypothetical protein